MASQQTHLLLGGAARLRRHVAALFELRDCRCVDGAAIDGNCMDCGAPSFL